MCQLIPDDDDMAYYLNDEDKPRVPEPTNYKKVAKYSIVLIIINLLTCYIICFTDNTEDQKAVFTLMIFMAFMVYTLMVVFSVYAR